MFFPLFKRPDFVYFVPNTTWLHPQGFFVWVSITDVSVVFNENMVTNRVGFLGGQERIMQEHL